MSVQKIEVNQENTPPEPEKVEDELVVMTSLIGKTVYRDVFDDKGELIAKEGEEIDEDILLEAKDKECLVQLIMKTYPS